VPNVLSRRAAQRVSTEGRAWHRASDTLAGQFECCRADWAHAQGLYDSTLIIICAKHGQSPIDVTKHRNIGSGQLLDPASLQCGRCRGSGSARLPRNPQVSRRAASLRS
jgi:L-asparaginase II